MPAGLRSLLSILGQNLLFTYFSLVISFRRSPRGSDVVQCRRGSPASWHI
jgi:hypothetical protein